jgi:hypothetical protein
MKMKKSLVRLVLIGFFCGLVAACGPRPTDKKPTSGSKVTERLSQFPKSGNAKSKSSEGVTTLLQSNETPTK